MYICVQEMMTGYKVWLTWNLKLVNGVKVLLLMPFSAQIHDAPAPKAVLDAHLDSLCR